MTTNRLHIIRIDSPQNGAIITKGDLVNLSIKLIDSVLVPDSLQLFVNNEPFGEIGLDGIIIGSEHFQLGANNIRVAAWRNKQRQSASVGLVVKSNIVPKQLKYKVIQVYNHDPQAYTQGLFFHNGFLYEGTGQKGASSLRMVELRTGKVLQSINLGNEYFGEGVALLNGTIYQLTWTSGTGFTYDLQTFTKKSSFSYSTQGWGLTTNGNHLIMSDGSNIIRFVDPNGFNQLRHIEVFDNNGPVKLLNELEYIDNQIFANVYLTNKVVVIDPATGAVTASIDFSDILPKNKRSGREDVFNGIAHDTLTHHTFVTGKYWSKLFEVEIQGDITN